MSSRRSFLPSSFAVCQLRRHRRALDSSFVDRFELSPLPRHYPLRPSHQKTLLNRWRALGDIGSRWRGRPRRKTCPFCSAWCLANRPVLSGKNMMYAIRGCGTWSLDGWNVHQKHAKAMKSRLKEAMILMSRRLSGLFCGRLMSGLISSVIRSTADLEFGTSHQCDIFWAH